MINGSKKLSKCMYTHKYIQYYDALCFVLCVVHRCIHRKIGRYRKNQIECEGGGRVVERANESDKVNMCVETRVNLFWCRCIFCVCVSLCITTKDRDRMGA